jgi:hypothetical protein
MVYKIFNFFKKREILNVTDKFSKTHEGFENMHLNK